MKEKLDFEILKNRGILRWKNWYMRVEDEVKKMSKKSRNDKVVLIVNYNNFKLIEKLIKALVKETIKFDFLIIDNNSDLHNYLKFKEYIKALENLNWKNFFLLRLKDNLWGAWWYALWQEYLIKYGYKYIINIEDDVIPLQNNTLIFMFSKLKYYDEVLIKWKETNNYSVVFHFYWYTIDFLKNVGVVDPRFFMRADDFEYSLRIHKIRKEKKIKSLFVDDCFYTHPVLKSKNNKYWQIYFGQRNNLIAESRWRFSKYSLLVLFLYIWLWFVKLLHEKKIIYLKIIFLSFVDFLFCKYNYLINNRRLKEFKNKWVDDIYKICKSLYLPRNEFKNKYKKFYLLPSMCSFFLKKELNIKENWFLNLFNWCIITWLIHPFYPISLLSKQVISIEEVIDNKIKICVLKNKWIYRFIVVIFSFFITFILYLFLIPILVLRYLLGYLFKL